MKTTAGVTLVELLLGLAILAVVWFFCVPFGAQQYKKNQLNLVVDELNTIIHYAKIQALLLGEPLVLTPLPASDDWSLGMILFVDNKKHQYTEGSKLIHEWRWHSDAINVKWQGFQSSHYLLFDNNLRHSAVNGYFLINNNLQQYKVIVNRVGRTRIEH